DVIGRGSKVAGKLLGELDVQRLVNGRQDFLFQQPLDDESSFNAEFLGKFSDGDSFCDCDLPINRRRLKNFLAASYRTKASFFLVHLTAAVARPWLGRVAAPCLSRDRGGFRPQRSRI